MIRVTVVDDRRIIGSVYGDGGVDLLMAWAQEDEKSPGHCIFTQSGEIKEITDRDNVFELLVRATLNYLDLHGVGYGYCKNEELIAGLRKLGFKEDEKGVSVKISEFFKPCCSKNDKKV